jgi:FKBP-type peptidyl-prolyl cis-trans isomerase FkpA
LKETIMIRMIPILLLCAATGTSALAQSDGAAAQAEPGVATATPAPAPAPAPAAEPVQDPLVTTDQVVGTGAEAGPGSTVFVHYTGWLYKPMATRQRTRQFDSSHDRGEPLEFVLGAGRVIKGWDQGVAGMKVGGKRTLIIPSHLAYGKRGAGGMIAPDADLIFEVELVKVK